MRILSAVLIALSLAWGGGPAQAAPLDKVTIVLTSETPTMSPHTESNFIGTIIWRWAYDTLVSIETGTGKVVPWLAERWEKLGPTQMKFYLRKDAKFSDGTPVTSAAVKYSIDHIVAPETKSRQLTYFKEYKTIEIIDDHTFIWHSKSIDNGLLHRIARWGHVVNPKTKGKGVEVFAQATYGSGPYVMKSWTKGQRMILEASPTWWGKAKHPNMPKTVIVRAIPERATRVKALLADEVDIVAGVPPHLIPQIRENPKKTVATTPGVRIMYINYSHGLGPLADLNVRRAIHHAIDMASIQRTILGGLATPTGQLFHPWSFAGYLPDRNGYPYPYNPEKAKALMKASKHPNGFKITIYTANGRYPGDRETCEALPGMLKKIGIDSTCKPMNYSLFTRLRRAYIAKKEKEPAMFYQGFGNSAGDPALITRALLGCKGAWSYYCDKELDRLTDKAINTSDEKVQDEAFQKVMAYINDKALITTFFQVHDIYASDKRVNFTARHDEMIYPWELSAK
jgi:peptide/nickel transport system substrate-binding protein